MPFLHIKLVTDRDTLLYGSLKKAIRLCKNVKSDADKEIGLPSFDLAALMYHSDQNSLRTGLFYELAILAETQRFLDYLHHNKQYAKTLMVPDGSRAILDSDKKLLALTSLSIEMDDLLLNVAKEQSPYLATDLLRSREAVSALIIPSAL